MHSTHRTCIVTALLFGAGLCVLPLLASAHGGTFVGLDSSDAELHIFGYDSLVEYVPNPGHLNITYMLNNKEGWLYNVRVAVRLYEEGTYQSALPAYEVAYTDVFDVPENTDVKRVVEFDAPAHLSGAHTVELVLGNEQGMVFATAVVTDMVLEGEAASLSIDPESCTSLASDGEPLPITTVRQVDMGELETVACDVTNNTDAEQYVSPVHTSHARSIFGAVVSNGDVYEVEPVPIAPRTTEQVVWTLDTATPQSYYVQLLLEAPEPVLSDMVSMKYVVRGESATILNAQFDRSTYKAGDVARFAMLYVGSANGSTTEEGAFGTVDVSVINVANGQVCGTRSNVPIENLFGTTEALVRLDADCCTPGARVALKGVSGSTLAEVTYGLRTAPTPVAPSIVPEPAPEPPTFSSSMLGLLLMHVVAVVVLVVVYVVMRRKKCAVDVRDDTSDRPTPPPPPPPSAIAVVLVLGAATCLVPTHTLEAYTQILYYDSYMTSVTANVDPFGYKGEDISVTALAQDVLNAGVPEMNGTWKVSTSWGGEIFTATGVSSIGSVVATLPTTVGTYNVRVEWEDTRVGPTSAIVIDMPVDVLSLPIPQNVTVASACAPGGIMAINVNWDTIPAIENYALRWCDASVANCFDSAIWATLVDGVTRGTTLFSSTGSGFTFNTNTGIAPLINIKLVTMSPSGDWGSSPDEYVANNDSSPCALPDCPFVPSATTQVVDLADGFVMAKAGYERGTIIPLSTPLPAGDYTVSLFGYDKGFLRVYASQVQPDEVWALEFLDAANTSIAVSSATIDVPDLIPYAPWFGEVNSIGDPVSLNRTAESVRAYTRAAVTKGSVYTGCAAISPASASLAGNITGTNCTVTVPGTGSCDAFLSWSWTAPPTSSEVTVDGALFSTLTSAVNEVTTITLGNHIATLYDDGTPIDSAIFSAICGSGLTQSGTVCVESLEPIPQ